ncbi:MAG: hypothetical protein OXG13_13540 [Gemmatimonadaceae bacterium]|nr:hypothetical protein [Gemmatimonadaceae bacterium]
MGRYPSWLLAIPILTSAVVAHAHIGDQIYPFYELLDEDLDRIDLTDGSVEDWYEVIGEPSLTASDFLWQFGRYDLSDVDFRIWLAWNQGSGTLWIAMERFDDLYINNYDGAGLHAMHRWDSSLEFMVDGDHTGGVYGFLLGINCEECTDEEVLWNNRQAQRWIAIAEAPGGGDILDYDGASDWVIREPYAVAGGGVIGESPATTVTEFKVTPFDDLIYDDEEASEVSQLFPGKVIGFTISTKDNDAIRAWEGPVSVQMSLGGKLRDTVDADRYLFGRNSCDGCTVEETRLLNNRQAQHYLAIAETTDGQHVGYDGAGEWVVREPYAAAGGGVLGATPVTTVTEMKVTPFDDLLYDDEAASVTSELYPGKVIGFTIKTIDNDATEWPDGTGAADHQWLSDRVSTLSLADLFVDGLLLGAGEDPSRYDDISAVEPSSWGRIKAALELAPRRRE